MIISKLLLASKGIPALLGMMIAQILLASTEKKSEQQREFGTDCHRPTQKQFPMVNMVQKGTGKQESKHTLIKSSAELSQARSTSFPIADFSHEQSLSQILCDSNKLKT